MSPALRRTHYTKFTPAGNTHNTLSTLKYWLGKLLVSECHCQYSGISKTALLQPSYKSMLLVPPFFLSNQAQKNKWHLGFYYCQGDWKSLFGTDGLISEAVPLPICLKCCVPSLHASNKAKTGALSFLQVWVCYRNILFVTEEFGTIY